MNNNFNINEKNIFNSLVYFKLISEKEYLEINIKEKKDNVKENVNKWNVFQKVANNINQSSADKKTDKLLELGKATSDYVDQYGDYIIYDKDELQNAINEYFNSTTNATKILLCIKLYFDNSYKYNYLEDINHNISRMLFPSEDTYKTIINKFKNYMDDFTNDLFGTHRYDDKKEFNIILGDIIDYTNNKELILENLIINIRKLDFDYLALLYSILLLIIDDYRLNLSVVDYKDKLTRLENIITNLYRSILDSILIDKTENLTKYDLLIKFTKKLARLNNNEL